MKLNELPLPGLIALGLTGMAATAVLGFAAGTVLARDPDILQRAARRLARGLEHVSLMAAQAREHVGDLWAEAREEARTAVDAADFDRAAETASAVATTSEAASAPTSKPARKRSSRRAKPGHAVNTA